MKPDIDIYYASVRGFCAKALDFFRSRNLDFRAFAVEWDGRAARFVDSPNTRELYRRCGGEVDIVPQIFVNGTHIRGWRTLEPMIASGAFDRLIRGGDGER